MKTTEKTAKVEKDRITIMFPYDPTLVAAVKNIPGRRFHGDVWPKHWTAPISIDAAEQLDSLGFALDTQLQELLNRNSNVAEETEPVKVEGLKRELFTFQEQGVAFIEQKKGRVLIADEMGLGKSIQALAWLHMHPELRPAIILCPAHLKLNWKREIALTLPGQQNVQILNGIDTTQPITGEIIIVNYDVLHKGWDEKLAALKPQVLVIDEGHYIKNNKALRTKATKKLARKIPHVIALTGTPIVNRPVEGFNLIQVVNNQVFPDFWDYARKYCNAKHTRFGWDMTGASNKEELHKKLTQSLMIRRKKADVLKDLPRKLYSYVPVEMTNDKAYQKAELNFMEWLEEQKGVEAAQRAKNAEHLVKIEALKQLAVKGKMKQAVAWIQDFIEDNGKLVVFAVHKSTIDRLMEAFGDIAVKVDGGMTGSKRDDAVQRFQQDESVRLFVGNIQAAGTGLTLTAASAVAFVELPWTPGELVQAEDRCHRIGQQDTVNVYYLLAEETIEQRMAELLDSKRTVLDAIIDGEETEDVKMLTELIENFKTKGVA